MRDKSPAITVLRWIGEFLPGDYLKTTFYLYAVAAPRKLVRLALNGFYRTEHIYDVLKEAKKKYCGKFTILEFGVNKGYAFVKLLYATRYTGMQHRATVHGFDTFEGMPSSDDRRDTSILTNRERWIEGQFQGEYEQLNATCSRTYTNYQLHRGLFEETLTDEFLETLREQPPILVWIDCDFYSSTRSVFERLIPFLPNGCVIYFDEIEFNYGSRFTGEARVVHEINQGMFGDGIELILDTRLSLDSKRVYRFMRFQDGMYYDPLVATEHDQGRRPVNHSPLP